VQHHGRKAGKEDNEGVGGKRLSSGPGVQVGKRGTTTTRRETKEVFRFKWGKDENLTMMVGRRGSRNVKGEVGWGDIGTQKKNRPAQAHL